MTTGGVAIGWPLLSGGRGDLVAIPTKRGEEAERQRAFIKDLRACLKRSRGRNRIASSLRDQLIGLVQHCFRQRFGVIHPGMAKMAEWAGATEKQARNNARQLERWGVAISVAYQNGGRGNSTEYVIDLKALFSVLNLMGCKPTDYMRQFCVEKAEISHRIIQSLQPTTGNETRKPYALDVPAACEVSGAEKGGSLGAEKAEQNPEETSARFKDNSGPLSQADPTGHVPPSAGRSAKASLNDKEFKENHILGACQGARSARKGAATYEAIDPAKELYAPSPFGLLKAYPKQTFELLKVMAAWSEAIDRGLQPHDLIHLAEALRQQVQAGTLDVHRLPDLHIWLGKITWHETDQPAEAAE